MHPAALLTVKVYLPVRINETVVLVPVPVDIKPPGLRVRVQLPCEGNPFNTTLPVDAVHVGWLMIPVTGDGGVAFGAVVPLPTRLVQPFTVVVTVYIPDELTVIDEVAAPVLHKNVPVAAVERVEVLLQLFTTVTTGVAGVDFGAAVPLPARLVQPFTVVVTVYLPDELTVIDEVAAPVLHNNVPVAAVESVEVLLQLSTTVTNGVAGVDFGAAVPLPARLVQPFTVVVTVYIPDELTIIDEVTAPMLHNNVPVAAVESVEVLLQLFTTVTTGVAGATFGAAVPLPARLVQPFTVVVTVYIPDELTVIEDVATPVFHNNVPVASVESVEVLLQLSTTVTTGVAGVDFGAAVPLPARLVQPFSVVVTVYIPDELTVIDEVAAPVLHNNVPVASVESVEVLLQLSTTVTTGVAGVDFGAAVPLPARLVQPFSVVVTVYIPDELTVIEDVATPVFHNNVPVAAVESVEVLLQLSTTVTTGVAGVDFGAAVPLPARLVQPFSVVVTVYIPDELTIIDEVAAPVLHNNVPVAVVDKVEVPSQLSVTVTAGAAGVVFTIILVLALFEQTLTSVNEYVIKCEPSPAVPGLNKPLILTPVPLKAPPPGVPTN